MQFGEKGYLALAFMSSSMEVKTETQTWPECGGRNRCRGCGWVLLTGLLCFLWLSQLLSYRTQAYQPMDGTTHNGMGPPPPITN